MANAIRISKPGYDVNNAKDNELLFNSDYPMLKIHKQGTGKVRINTSGLAVYTIKHDVGKVPMYFVRGEVMLSATTKSTYLTQYPVSIFFGLGVYAYHKVKPYKDKIEIYWDLGPAKSQTIKFDYFIFEDPITL